MKLCSNCEYQNKELKDLSNRNWDCPLCGSIHKRDLNVAINLLDKGLEYLLV